MIEKDFRSIDQSELRKGAAIWLQGKSFLDTSGFGPPAGTGRHPICGPFLIERIMCRSRPEPSAPGWAGPEPRVDIVDPATGDRRSMMSSWLLVPKEEK